MAKKQKELTPTQKLKREKRGIITLLSFVGAAALATTVTLPILYSLKSSPEFTPVVISDGVKAKGVSVVSSNIKKGEDSTIQLSLPEEKVISKIEIIIADTTITQDDKDKLDIDGAKLTIKGTAMVDNKVTINSIDLSEPGATKEEFLEKYKIFYQAYYEDPKNFKSMTFNYWYAKYLGEYIDGASIKYNGEKAEATFIPSGEKANFSGIDVNVLMLEITKLEGQGYSIVYTATEDEVSYTATKGDITQSKKFNNLTYITEWYSNEDENKITDIKDIVYSTEDIAYVEGVDYPEAKGDECLVRATYLFGFSETGTISVPEYLTVNGISKKVTGVADWAFCTNIGYSASLNKIEFAAPANIETIGHHAFAHCSNLTTCPINDLTSLKTIGHDAFDDDTKLSEVIINSNVTKIEFQAFKGCTGLTAEATGKGVTFNVTTNWKQIDGSSITISSDPLDNAKNLLDCDKGWGKSGIERTA